jgi:tRNA-2-methylthio-N6-dimethylallyladenosine synthase
VKEQRLARLLELVDEQQAAHLRSLVGSRVRVLVEDRNLKDRERYTGRSHRNEIVHVKPISSGDLTGRQVVAVVDQANNHSLLASLQAFTG